MVNVGVWKNHLAEHNDLKERRPLARQTHTMKPCNKLRQKEQRVEVLVGWQAITRSELLETRLMRISRDCLYSQLQVPPICNYSKKVRISGANL